VGRLRSFHRERLQEQDWLAGHAHDADATVMARHQQVLEMLEVQTVHVTRRAKLIQSTLLCLLAAIGCLVICSLFLGLSILHDSVIYVAAAIFVVGLCCVLGAVLFAARELTAALQPIELESRFIGDLTETVEPGV
jgi:hypothetical protein